MPPGGGAGVFDFAVGVWLLGGRLVLGSLVGWSVVGSWLVGSSVLGSSVLGSWLVGGTLVVGLTVVFGGAGLELLVVGVLGRALEVVGGMVVVTVTSDDDGVADAEVVAALLDSLIGGTVTVRPGLVGSAADELLTVWLDVGLATGVVAQADSRAAARTPAPRLRARR